MLFFYLVCQWCVKFGSVLIWVAIKLFLSQKRPFLRQNAKQYEYIKNITIHISIIGCISR